MTFCLLQILKELYLLLYHIKLSIDHNLVASMDYSRTGLKTKLIITEKG